jgi:hypothetical protein
MVLKSFVFIIFFAMSGLAAMASSPKIENRCGWFDNPTPGNAWLHDKDGEWTIATQGEYEAQGHWNPAFDLDNEQTFMRTGSSYGHGCVCMKVESDLAAKKILKVSSIKIKSLSDCRKDKSLKEPQ